MVICYACFLLLVYFGIRTELFITNVIIIQILIKTLQNSMWNLFLLLFEANTHSWLFFLTGYINSLFATNNDYLHLKFSLRHVTTNVEYFSPMMRLQRQHDEKFRLNSLNEVVFEAFKRYTTHEVKRNSMSFDYTFNWN